MNHMNPSVTHIDGLVQDSSSLTQKACVCLEEQSVKPKYRHFHIFVTCCSHFRLKPVTEIRHNDDISISHIYSDVIHAGVEVYLC